MTNRQIFIEACFSNDLNSFYKEMIESKYISIQNFNSELKHLYWNPSNICCESKEILNRENIDIKVGYWTPFVWKPIHKDLLLSSKRSEAFNCQCIDMSCNDCIYLDRGNSKCSLLNKNIKIVPNTCHPQNINCFKHRLCPD